MAAVSWAISLRFMSCGGNAFAWEPHEQVLPFSDAMTRFFAASDYRAICRTAKEQLGHFAIRWDEADRYAKLAADQPCIPVSPW
jgi:hypothetical protein